MIVAFVVAPHQDRETSEETKRRGSGPALRLSATARGASASVPAVPGSPRRGRPTGSRVCGDHSARGGAVLAAVASQLGRAFPSRTSAARAAKVSTWCSAASVSASRLATRTAHGVPGGRVETSARRWLRGERRVKRDRERIAGLTRVIRERDRRRAARTAPWLATRISPIRCRHPREQTPPPPPGVWPGGSPGVPPGGGGVAGLRPGMPLIPDGRPDERRAVRGCRSGFAGAAAAHREGGRGGRARLRSAHPSRPR